MHSESRVPYPVWLRSRLDARRRRNPAFSLRAYAKALGLSPATLSALMNGKRQLTLSAALRIADREDLSPLERQTFLSGLLQPGSKTAVGSSTSTSGTKRTNADSYTEIDLDRYALIADWYHFAILSLGNLPGSRLDPQWVAGKLGISMRDASAALQRLRRLKLIARSGVGFRQATGPITTQSGFASAAIRTSHRQLLAKAEAALDEVPVDARDMSAMIMAIAPENLGAARDLIKQFRRDLSNLLESGRPASVYACTVQLFPLTKEPL